jgi:CRISPR-associated protein Csx14
MSISKIPVDPLNPGQVFACLGFLEVAELLLEDVEGGFDWDKTGRVYFQLSSQKSVNPFADVLRELRDTKIVVLVPIGCGDGDANDEDDEASGDDDDSSDEPSSDAMALTREPTEVSPSSRSDQKEPTFAVELRGHVRIPVTSWADGSTRESCKLFAGRMRGSDVLAKLFSRSSMPPRATPVTTRANMGLQELLRDAFDQVVADPFAFSTSWTGGTFNFDPKRTWAALDAGYSLNDQGHSTQGTPLVEVLALIGLEHFRPTTHHRNRRSYSLWSRLVPPSLARVALAGSATCLSETRTFSFVVGINGKTKYFQFAHEEKRS